MSTPSLPGAVTRTFMAADGEMTTETFDILDFDLAPSSGFSTFATDPLTSLSDVTTLINENGCFASSATTTILDAMTAILLTATCPLATASSSASTQSPCDVLCGAIGDLLSKHGYTDGICGEGFTDKANDCVDCLTSTADDSYTSSNWQYRARVGLDICQKAKIDMARLAGEIIGGIVGWIALAVVVYLLRRWEKKKKWVVVTGSEAGAGDGAEVQESHVVELGVESGWSGRHEMEAPQQLGELCGKQILPDGEQLTVVAGLVELPANEEVRRGDRREKNMMTDEALVLAPDTR